MLSIVLHRRYAFHEGAFVHLPDITLPTSEFSFLFSTDVVDQIFTGLFTIWFTRSVRLQKGRDKR